MNTTITITPRAFGNIAAAAMAHSCDVTTFLIRAATAAPVTAAPAPEPAPAPAPAPVEEAPELPMLTDDDLPLLTGCY